MAVTVNETETKYDAPAGAGLPGLDRLPGVAATSGPEEQRLEAEYYDTDDLRLIRAGITLRRHVVELARDAREGVHERVGKANPPSALVCLGDRLSAGEER